MDHVLISPTCVQRIQEISSNMNLSDHRPLCVKLDCAYTCTQSGHQLSPSQLSSHNVAWHKATPTQILDYQSLVVNVCHRILIPTDVISCTNLACSEHCNLLDHLCVQLIDSLIQCADCAIPKHGGRHLAGWSEEVKPIREKSLLWSKIWHKAGCPSIGVFFQLKKHAKARYKYAVRRLRRKQDQLRSRKMTEAFVGDNSRDFWQEVSHFN